ncbi:hypothetical protein CMI37_08025 [Candidatus Pacearchaeota archaeon]|nr:hypothetical protein [Candidatus Pacearchaeota archaeon]
MYQLYKYNPSPMSFRAHGHFTFKMGKICAIFIDGGYLRALLKRYNNFPLDYLKFSDKISKVINAERLRTYYYDCLPILKKDNEKSKIDYDNKKNFINKLMQLSRFDVKLGELQLIKDTYKQKKIDVIMSLDIAKKCFEKQIHYAVLIAGDSDFVPSVEEAKNYGAIVYLFADKDSLNKELFNKADEFFPLNKEFFEDCKLVKHI